MQKSIAHPTDSRLYDKARQQLVAPTGEANITLRQNYNWLAPRLAMQVGRYAHARQFKRMRKALKKLKGRIGRALRDLHRQLDATPGDSCASAFWTAWCWSVACCTKAPEPRA